MYYSIATNSNYALCSFFEKTVDVYDLNTFKRINRIQTIFDFGGNRLTINMSNQVFCSASYYNGIALYEISNGREIWINKKIKKIQTVFLSDNYAFVHNEMQELNILSLSSGISVHYLKNIEGIYKTGKEGRYIIKKKSTLELLEIENEILHVFTIFNLTVSNSFHNVALFEEVLFVSYLHQSFLCYSLDGNLLWTSDIEKGYVLNSISTDMVKSELCCFAGFDNNIRQEHFIIHVDFETGIVTNKFILDENVIDIEIVESKGIIVCSNGSILDLKNGAILHNFQSD